MGRSNPTGPRKRTNSASDKPAAAVKSERGRRLQQQQQKLAASGQSNDKMANEQWEHCVIVQVTFSPSMTCQVSAEPVGVPKTSQPRNSAEFSKPFVSSRCLCPLVGCCPFAVLKLDRICAWPHWNIPFQYTMIMSSSQVSTPSPPPHPNRGGLLPCRVKPVRLYIAARLTPVLPPPSCRRWASEVNVANIHPVLILLPVHIFV